MDIFLRMPITMMIIIGTIVSSIMAFPHNVQGLDQMRKPEWFDKFKFNATAVAGDGEIYRLFSYGFVHANWMHLAFNMFTLFFFGGLVESTFKYELPMLGGLVYLAFYIVAIGASTIHDLVKYKNQPYYNAVGASGAVSAVVFAAILFQPNMKLMFIFLPIPITAWIFGLLYLAYSVYMAKKGTDNIGHYAHFWGAIFGFVMPIFINPDFLSSFFGVLF